MDNRRAFLMDLYETYGIYSSRVDFAHSLISTIFGILKDRKELGDDYPYSKTVNFLKALPTNYNLGKSLQDKLKTNLANRPSEELRDLAQYVFEFALETDGKMMESSNKEITNLAIQLLRVSSGDMVYDLGSGYGNFLTEVHRYARKHGFYYKDLMGIEINPATRAYSLMNMRITGAYSWKIDEGDFSDGLPHIYNKGFVFPPIGLRMRENKKSVESKIFNYSFNPNLSSYEWLFVDRLLDGLVGHDHRAVAIMCLRCLYSKEDKEYRNLLLKSGWIESIIELPAGSLSFGGVKVCVVVFSENNKSVKILNCDDVIDGAKGRFSNYRLPYEKVIGKLDIAPRKDVEELLNANSLVPSSLIASEGVSFEGVPLKDLAEVITGCQYTSKHFENMFVNRQTGYRILTSSDIQDGVVDWDRLQSIDYNESKFDKYAVKKDDVVVTAKSSKVKIAVVDIEPNEKILVTGGMLIIRPNTNKLDPTFLKIFLNSNKGQAALRMIQKGSYIVSMNAKDLGFLLIPEVSLESQINYSKKYNSKLSSFLVLKEELKKLEQQINNFDIDNMED